MGAATRAATSPVLLLVALAGGLAPAHTQPLDAAALVADLEHLSALSPRLEGSANETKALAYIRARLTGAGLMPQSISYESPQSHSFSSGLEVVLPGAGPDTLLVVVPVDHDLGSAPGRDGAAGIALALHLVETLRPSGRLTLRFAFLGAEHGAGVAYPLGSHRYLEGLQVEGAVGVVYLHIAAIPATLTLVAGTNGRVAPRWFVRATARSLETAGLGFVMRGTEVQLHRIGLAVAAGPLGPYLEADYPAVGLTAEPEVVWEARDGDRERYVGAFDAAFAQLVERLGRGMPAVWDRHYLAFQVGPRVFTVPEVLYVGGLGALVALCLLYAVLSGGRGRRYAVALARGLWSLPIHLGMLFLFLLVPTLAVRGLLWVLGFPALWERAPLELGLLKLLLATSLVALFAPLLTRSALPRGGRFYAAAALAVQGGVLVAVTLYEISLAAHLAWSLLFLVLSVLARNRGVKVALFLAAPVWLARTTAELFWLRELHVVRWFLLDPYAGNLLLAGLAAPYYLMLLRLRLLLTRRRKRLRRVLIAVSGMVLLLAASATALWLAHERAYRRGAARPLQATAVLDYVTGDAGLEMSGPVSLGEVTVKTPEATRRMFTRSPEAHMDLRPPPLPLRLHTAVSSFLNRRSVTLLLQGTDDSNLWPYRLALRLSADREFVLFDASLPFHREPSGSAYTIHVGASPPQPLEIELTLPRGVRFELGVEATYLVLPPDVQVTSPGATVQPGMQVRVEFGFAT
jgi:hypothetical protein